jgi:hypothetical protein
MKQLATYTNINQKMIIFYKKILNFFEKKLFKNHNENQKKFFSLNF